MSTMSSFLFVYLRNEQQQQLVRDDGFAVVVERKNFDYYTIYGVQE